MNIYEDVTSAYVLSVAEASRAVRRMGPISPTARYGKRCQSNERGAPGFHRNPGALTPYIILNPAIRLEAGPYAASRHPPPQQQNGKTHRDRGGSQTQWDKTSLPITFPIHSGGKGARKQGRSGGLTVFGGISSRAAVRRLDVVEIFLLALTPPRRLRVICDWRDAHSRTARAAVARQPLLAVYHDGTTQQKTQTERNNAQVRRGRRSSAHAGARARRSWGARMATQPSIELGDALRVQVPPEGSVATRALQDNAPRAEHKRKRWGRGWEGGESRRRVDEINGVKWRRISKASGRRRGSSRERQKDESTPSDAGRCRMVMPIDSVVSPIATTGMCDRKQEYLNNRTDQIRRRRLNPRSPPKLARGWGFRRRILRPQLEGCSLGAHIPPAPSLEGRMTERMRRARNRPERRAPESTENGGGQQSQTGIAAGPRVGAAEEDGRVRAGGGVQKPQIVVEDAGWSQQSEAGATERHTARHGSTRANPSWGWGWDERDR
ncbi:hypothetical protein C8J57DRAFT_1213301 [Mycena rebaudengoi]|nr:hypothetical protein C8J57DRAFT_1213301 [Mycena rebaudengoi]